MERDFRGWNALDRAAHQGDCAHIQSLLQQGADPSDGDLGGYTPLYRALKAGQEPAALLLLEAVGRAPAKRGQNALSETVHDLLPQDPVAPDNLLQLAAEKGLLQVLEALLPRTTPPAQERALLPAVKHGRTAIAKRLLEQPGKKKLDLTLDYALIENQDEIAQLLLEKGAQPGERTLEHCVYHEHSLLPQLETSFPQPVQQARARVQCPHDDIREWEFGRYCHFCNARWP